MWRVDQNYFASEKIAIIFLDIKNACSFFFRFRAKTHLSLEKKIIFFWLWLKYL